MSLTRRKWANTRFVVNLGPTTCQRTCYEPVTGKLWTCIEKGSQCRKKQRSQTYVTCTAAMITIALHVYMFNREDKTGVQCLFLKKCWKFRKWSYLSRIKINQLVRVLVVFLWGLLMSMLPKVSRPYNDSLWDSPLWACWLVSLKETIMETETILLLNDTQLILLNIFIKT